MTFQDKVYAVVKQIPRGRVLTYQEVAKRVGSPKSARAVGNVLHHNHDPNIPCHRVILSGGKFGGYNRGAREKIRKLKEEGYNPMDK